MEIDKKDQGKKEQLLKIFLLIIIKKNYWYQIIKYNSIKVWKVKYLVNYRYSLEIWFQCINQKISS